MQPLNAFDAIAPAFTRTHQILFTKPWKVGQVWKLCTSHYLGLLGGAFIPVVLCGLFVPPEIKRMPGVLPGLLLALLLMTVVLSGLFYIGVRFQFVDFEMIVTRARFIAPMWNRYGRRLWPFLWIKVLAGSVITLAIAPLTVRSLRGLILFFQSLPQGAAAQPPDPQIFVGVYQRFLGFYALLGLMFFLIKAVSTLLEDFALPFYILEPVTLHEALARGWKIFAAEPAQCLLYLFMKFILSIGGFVLQYAANLIFLFPAMIVFFFAAMLGALAAHSSAVVGVVVLVVAVVLYIAFIAWSIFFSIGSFGYVMMLLEAYGIYFVAGRYPRLGDLLEPPAPPALFSPAPEPPPPYPGDDLLSHGEPA